MVIIRKYISKIGLPFVILLILYLINPYGLNIYIGYLIVGSMFFRKKFLLRNLDTSFFVLLLFSITYAAFFSFEPKAGNQYIIIYAVVPGAFYLLGKYFAEKVEGRETHLIYILLLIGSLFSITAMLSILKAIQESGFSVVERNLPDFWNGQIIPATIMGSFFIFNMCIPALLVTKIKKLNLLYRVLILGFFIISVVCVLRIGSRTQLGISMLTLLISLLYIMPRQSFKRNIIVFLFFGLLVFGVTSNVNFDLDQDWLSAFAGRMEDGGASDIASGGGRTDRWVKSMEYLFKKPLGWEESEFGHAHNLWFDALRIGGVIPFLFLVMFTIGCFNSIRKAIGKVNTAYALNNQIIVYFLSFMSVFMVEPTLEGMFSLFAVFCLFMGIVKKYSTTQLQIS